MRVTAACVNRPAAARDYKRNHRPGHGCGAPDAGAAGGRFYLRYN